jgi:TRAP-type C4-dicarboxylate transport system permease small subunit
VSAQNSKTRRDAGWSWVPGIDTLPRGPLAWVDLGLMITTVAGLALMALALIWQVFSRYVLSAPTVWSEEFSLLVFVWVAMFGIAVAVRRGEHLTLDVASRLLASRPLATKILATVVTALIVVTLVIIAASCVQLLGPANRQSLSGIQTGLGIPARVSWIYAALPVGLGLAAVFAIERLALLLTGRVSVLNADADQQVVQELEHEEGIAREQPGPTTIGKDL